MKLIIDIPEETYKAIMLGKWDNNGLAFYVKIGTPLDDVKAEIKNDWQLKEFPSSPFSCGLRHALDILDNIIGKADMRGE